MKVLRSAIFRALCAIIVGVLLIQYREQTVTWITIAIGVLFFLSGIISLTTYYGAKRHFESLNNVTVTDAEGNVLTGERPTFPIVGVGSVILGIILALMPATFVTWLMYILSAILILGAVNMFVALAAAMKFARIGIVWWIVPSILLIVSIYLMFQPMEAAGTPLYIIGWCMMVYGVVECVNALKIHRCRKQWLETTDSNSNFNS
jgi:uncharacterized membrane protein HdeD (DUF308 family)